MQKYAHNLSESKSSETQRASLENVPPSPLNSPSAREKEVPPQEGQVVASLPGHEAEMGEQVLPISSGDEPTLMFKL